jgi:membrane protein DedA with SNARE-associated domain
MFERITGIIEQTGYFGVFALMFIENAFPPIPSELIMPLAGFTAARGELNVVLVVAAGSAGSLAGALAWYYVGRWLGCEGVRRLAAKHGRLMTVAPHDIDAARGWFKRHGGMAVLFGRLVPAVRTLISLPAGMVEMALPRFLAFSAVGTFLWSGLLTSAGYLLEDQYQMIAGWLDPVTNVVLAGAVLLYLFRVATFRPQARP